jgi:hypothetical protein
MEKQNYEVVMSLMAYHIKDNKRDSRELKEALDILHTIFFMLEQIDVGIKRDGALNYIGSDEFHQVHSCIDVKKLKLFKIIASL